METLKEKTFVEGRENAPQEAYEENKYNPLRDMDMDDKVLRTIITVDEEDF